MPNPAGVEREPRGGKRRGQLQVEFLAGGVDEHPRFGSDFAEQPAERHFSAVERADSRLEAREVEQIVENAEQAVGVVARGFEQLALRGGEAGDILLQQQINGHPQTRERCLEFVAHGADEVGFRVVEQPEFRHVLQDDRGALELRELVADGENPRQVVAVLAADAERDDARVVGGQIVLAGREHAGERLGEHGRETGFELG